MKKQEEFDFKFKISNAYLGNLVRMNYLPWDALAEWVDNSVQSYLNNQKFLDKRYEKNNECLEIYITYRANQGILKVDDNAGGMTSDLLTKCMEMGDPDPNISKVLSFIEIKSDTPTPESETKQTVESEEKQCLEDLGTKRISRNAISPRTGKKYKRCCGKI